MRRGLIGSPGELAAEHCAAHHHMCAGCARHPRIEGGMQGFTRQAQRWHGPQAVCADTRAEGKAGTQAAWAADMVGAIRAACNVEEGPLAVVSARSGIGVCGGGGGGDPLHTPAVAKDMKINEDLNDDDDDSNRIDSN